MPFCPARFNFHFRVFSTNFNKRPPIVTIMGHVDHGKTSMLDYLRKSKIAANEAGGITQHIGAFQVALKSGLITFIDTPGHAAFSAIRQRGAQVTDLIVLVVAIEDGVMPQTEEVIKLAKSASIPIIIAMNKWDKLIAVAGSISAANNSPQVRKLKDSLARHGIELEEFGGSIQCIPVSALTGFNMDALQESILAEAEMMDLLSDPQAVPRATVIEARNILGLGACATVIVREGTLKPGIFCATDTTYTRIRSLTDTTTGKVVKLALPSQPCEITGWKNSVLPLIGSDLNQFSSETECKKWIDAGERDREFIEVRQGESEASKREALDKQLLRLRKERARDLTLKPIHIHSYDSLANQTDPNFFILEVMLYADVTGSLEALKKALADLPRDKVQLKIVSSELGPPTPSTLQHLSASPVILVAFNVTIPKVIEKNLQDRGIKSIQHGVIYHLLDEIKENMVSLLPPVESESPQGTARVLQLFPFGTKEIVAGCNIEDGLFLRSQSSNFKYNLERNDRIIWTGSIKTLKHFKKDITQAQKGMECGIVLDGLDPNLLQLNDVIKCVKITRTPQKI